MYGMNDDDSFSFKPNNDTICLIIPKVKGNISLAFHFPVKYSIVYSGCFYAFKYDLYNKNITTVTISAVKQRVQAN